MIISIEGEEREVEEVRQEGYLPLLILADGEEYYIARDSTHAGEAAKQYWKDLAEDDAREFICIIGAENLLRWALGQWAGPGEIHVRSLEEWFDLTAKYPEELWAGYDGRERECSFALQGEEYTVCYRWN